MEYCTKALCAQSLFLCIMPMRPGANFAATYYLISGGDIYFFILSLAVRGATPTSMSLYSQPFLSITSSAIVGEGGSLTLYLSYSTDYWVCQEFFNFFLLTFYQSPPTSLEFSVCGDGHNPDNLLPNPERF